MNLGSGNGTTVTIRLPPSDILAIPTPFYQAGFVPHYAGQMQLNAVDSQPEVNSAINARRRADLLERPGNKVALVEDL